MYSVWYDPIKDQIVLFHRTDKEASRYFTLSIPYDIMNCDHSYFIPYLDTLFREIKYGMIYIGEFN